MLVRIHPEQFEKGWETFAPLLQEAFPPRLAVQKDALVKVLRAVLGEKATPWIEVNKETRQSRAFILTTIDREPIMHNRRLLIYVLTIFGDAGEPEEWRQAINTLRKHARKQDCNNIITYVYDEDYARYLSMLGADTDTVMAQFEV